MEQARYELTRKEMLKLSLLGSAALLLPAERVARTQLAVADRLPEGALPEPFEVPFSVPPVARPVRSTATTDYYRMTMQSALVPIVPGLAPTEIWGFEGTTPGPTFRVRRGRNVVVRHVNRLPETHPVLGYESTTSVHLHGADSLPQYDGYAEDVTAPGEYKDYRYANLQGARTIWYHDHAIHHTAPNAYMGLAGMWIVHDDVEEGLPIPHGRYDVPLILKDAIFATNGSLIFDDGESRGGHDSLFGDVILTNGKPWPVMEVERRKYRFRVLNAAISRSFKLALDSGEPLTVVGSDAGLLPAPVETEDLVVGMGERYEVVVDFEKYAIGQQVVLRNLGVENNVDFPKTNRVMRFDVADEPADTSNNKVPDILDPNNPVLKVQESEAVRTRRFEFGRRGGEWTVNDETWDPNRIDAKPGLGDVEVWEFENKSGGWNHPVHAHLVDFRILSRTDGKDPGVKPYEVGPKDDVYVGENETVRVLMKFGPHEGRYMIHCHNLVHEDHDMMAQFEVGQGGDDPVAADPARPISDAPSLFPVDGTDDGSGGGTTTPVPPPAADAAPTVTPLRPRHNSVTRDRTPTILVTVRDARTDLTKGDISLFLDGRRINGFRYDRATNRLVYTSGTLRIGWHTARIVAANTRRRSTSRSWRFRIVR